jgi:solute carrier family 8 (sodium/calcium exchanger)
MFCLDSIPYEKMVAALTNTKLMNGIKKASPIGQTSCLEGFHSVLNQFAPKMIGYSYPGMFCR